jgi:hypothetical protein
MVDANLVQMFTAMNNPQFAAQQQSLARQQAIAQQIMEQGNQPEDVNKLANPGGFVVPYSPLLAASKAAEKGLGAYMQKQLDEKQLAAYQSLAGGVQGGATADASGSPQQLGNAMDSPNMNDVINEGVAPELMKANYALRNAGPMKAAETANTPYITPQGTYQMGSQINNSKPTPAQNLGAAMMPPAQKTPAPMNQTNAEKMTSLFGGQELGTPPIEAPAQPVNLSAPTSADAPLAAGGKPLIADMSNFTKAEGAGPKYATENTKQGVELASKFADSDIKAYEAMGTQASNVEQMKGRLDFMADAMKSGNAGNIISQYPDFANKLIASGIITDKGSINDVAAFQAYEGAQVQEALNQIKAAAPDNRIMQTEFNKISEKLGDPSQRPEAIHEIMSMTKGFANWTKDMVGSYNDIGGLDNRRKTSGTTLRPLEHQLQFEKSHDVYDYIKAARKDIGPFNGMAGNNGENRISIIDPNGNAGTIDKEHLQGLLSAGGKLAQ